MGDVRETCCSKCIHYEVCKMATEFLKAQQAVNDLTVTLGQTENGVKMIRLHDIDYIESVNLVCKHFLNSFGSRGAQS